MASNAVKLTTGEGIWTEPAEGQEDAFKCVWYSISSGYWALYLGGDQVGAETCQRYAGRESDRVSLE